MLEECLALRRKLGNPREIAATLSTSRRSDCTRATRRRRARYEEEALGIFRSIGDRVGDGSGSCTSGNLESHVEEDTGARKHFEQSLALAREHRAPGARKRLRAQSGRARAGGGRPAGRAKRFTRSLKVCADAEDRRERNDRSVAARKSRRRRR